MFIITKLIGWIMLPPGLFLLLLLFALLALLFNKKNSSIFIVFLTLLIIYFFSIPLTGQQLLFPLETYYPMPDLKNETFDAILILGGGTVGPTLEHRKNGLSCQSSLRVLKGALVWQKYKKPIIVSGGKVFDAVEPEAESFERMLIELGVKKEDIIKETQSRNTIENAEYSAKIIQHYGYQKLLLITSAYHLKRSVLIFNRLNIQVVPLATDYRLSAKKISGYFFIPSLESLGHVYLALHEYLGIIYARIKLPNPQNHRLKPAEEKSKV